MLKNKIIKKNYITIDSKSGYSGAGKNYKSKFKFKNFYESTYAYAVKNHRHIAEIDQELFKISKKKALMFKEIIKSYNQYDWGINENFYIAASEALNLRIFNLFKFANIIKFDNDFAAFTEDRSWQINSWKQNQQYLLNFLKDNNLSKFHAYGSYYYLLFKIFNFRDLNFRLFLSYIIFYPYNLIKKIISIFKRKLK